MRAVKSLLLLLVAGFCLFGFLASGEPGPNHAYFRVGYAVVGVAAVVYAAVILTRRRA
jgi:hypothetical protein